MIPKNDIHTTIFKIIEAESPRYTDNPNDHGGPTKFGITLATLRGEPGYEHATASAVEHLTRVEAESIYVRRYAAPYTALSTPVIFNFVVNGAVQHGTAGMNKIIQRAVGVHVDGILGSGSWAAIQSAELHDPLGLLAALVAERCEYYGGILSRDHSQRVFAAGWFNRVAKDLR